MEKKNHISYACKRQWILRYVSDTCDHEIFYSYSSNFSLVGYIDSDWGGDVETRKSTGGYIYLFIYFYLGTRAFLWP